MEDDDLLGFGVTNSSAPAASGPITDNVGDGTGSLLLNGSTAPNSSALPLSSSVNTSGGNGNTSGFNLSSVLSGLSQVGSSAVNAYKTLSGTSTTTTAAAAVPSTIFGIPVTYLFLGGGVIALILFFTHRK